MATAKGNEKSYDGGKFQLVVKYTTTKSAIKFSPSVKITNDINHKHTILVEYVNTAGKWVQVGKFTVKKSVIEGLVQGDISNTDYKTKVRARISGTQTASTVTLINDIKPAKPTLTVYSDGSLAAFILKMQINRKGDAVPNNTIHIYRKTDQELATWDEIGTVNAQGVTTATTFKRRDQDVSTGHRYKYAISVSNQAGDSGKSESRWFHSEAEHPTNVAAAKVGDSDYHYRISFQVSAFAREIGSATVAYLLRKTDDGAWEVLHDMLLPAAQTQTLFEFHDTSTLPGHYYSYAIRTANGDTGMAEQEPIDGTDPIYNTPAKPEYVTASFSSISDIELKIGNENIVYSEKTEIQRRDSGGEWTTIAEIEEPRVVSYTDTSGMVGSIYRVRNIYDDMVSRWTTSEPVVATQRPDAPSANYPYPDSRLQTGEIVRLEWKHNARDGSEQTEADIQIYVNDELYETIHVTGPETFYDYDLGHLGETGIDNVAYRVRTRGAAPDYSPWSQSIHFKVVPPPVLSILAPQNNIEIDLLPIRFDITYTDYSSSTPGPASLQMKIYDGDDIVYNKPIDVAQVLDPQTGHMEFDFVDYLFQTGKAYSIEFDAVGHTYLTATARIGVTINYDNVSFIQPWYPDASVDEDTGIVTVTIDEATEPFDPDDPDDPTEYVDEPVIGGELYRVTGTERVLIADNLSVGDQYVDYYAPLNQLYRYELVQVSGTGKTSVMTQENQVLTPYWYVHWGPNNENICRAIWDPSGDVTLDRPEKELIRYSGRDYPVSYDSTAMNETFSYSGVIVDRDELNNFIKMIRAGGTGIWRSANGESYDAAFDFSYSADYTLATLRWNCKLNVTRIGG